MSNPDALFDVLVLGSGPAGLAAAISLARHGLRTAVLDKGEPTQQRIGEHLPPSGLSTLQQLGLPTAIMADQAHLPCPGVTSIWGDADTPQHADYLFHPYGHGLNLARPVFDQALAACARQAGVTLMFNTVLNQATRIQQQWQIGIRSKDAGQQIHARFVVDASGKAAAFARMQGSRIISHDAQLAACRTLPLYQARKAGKISFINWSALTRLHDEWLHTRRSTNSLPVSAIGGRLAARGSSGALHC